MRILWSCQRNYCSYQVGGISCKARMSSLWPSVWWGKQFQPNQTAVWGERVTQCMAETGGTFHHYIINPLTVTICPNLCNFQNLLSQCHSVFVWAAFPEKKVLLFMGLRWIDFFTDHRVTKWWGSTQVRNSKQESWWHTINYIYINSFPVFLCRGCKESTQPLLHNT